MKRIVTTLTVLPTGARAFVAMGALALAAIAPTAYAVDGWATQGGGTTGGSGGSTVTVTSLSALQSAITGTTAKVIYVSGTINLGSSDFYIGSNKTVIGVGSSSGFVGDMRAQGQKNLIFQNLHFTNPSGVGGGDGLTIEQTTNYFVTHCTFAQCTDGELDETHASDYGTVSWCKFYYSSDTGHDFVNLIGHSDSNGSQDTGHLRITMHHNWYSTLCKERMPRVRYGHVHVYNNYYGASGSHYNIGVGVGCQILSQNCYFDGQASPWANYNVSGYPTGVIHFSGHYYVNCSQPTWAPNSAVFTPPYTYTLDTASNVKSIVTNSTSGAGTH